MLSRRQQCKTTMREALHFKQIPQQHTHVRYDEKSDFVDSYLMFCSLSCVVFPLIFVYSFGSFYPLLSIPLFVYRLVWTWVKPSVLRVTIYSCSPILWFDFLSTKQNIHTHTLYGVVFTFFSIFLIATKFLIYIYHERERERKREQEQKKNSVHFYLSPSSHWFENRLFCTLIVPLPHVQVFEWRDKLLFHENEKEMSCYFNFLLHHFLCMCVSGKHLGGHSVMQTKCSFLVSRLYVRYKLFFVFYLSFRL